MPDCKRELIDRLFMILVDSDSDVELIKDRIIITLADYSVDRMETLPAIRNEQKNEYFLKRWLVAKTVMGCSERTIQAYKCVVKGILNAIGKDADAIEPLDIQMYFALKKANQKVSNSTLNNERHYLMSFYKYLAREGLVQVNPMDRIDNIKFHTMPKNAFTDEQVETLRGALLNEREKAVFEMLLSTGCRVSELVSIKIDDIKDSKVCILGKGGKYRNVYINAKAKIAVKNYLNTRKDVNPYLFVPGHVTENLLNGRHSSSHSIETMLRNIGKRAGVEKCHPHRFRRTCATKALNTGMPLELVSKMLGHAQLQTTQIYLDISEEEMEYAHKKFVR